MLDESKVIQRQARRRFIVFALMFSILVILLVLRLFDLSFFNRDFLLKQGNARILRKVEIPAYRGMITDRNGDPLAISTPVNTLWANPKLVQTDNEQLYRLAKLLQMSPASLKKKIEPKGDREFVYLKRQLSPEAATQILALKIPGIFSMQEYKRFYPEGEVDSHLVGFTNIDDHGQEGLELAFDRWLSGKPGQKEVIKDRLGHIIQNVAILKKPEQGHDLTLSIDQRIQYIAYQALKKQVDKYQADSGSLVVLNVKTGEVLGMVNQPSYDPNNRPNTHDGRFRNRAATDMYEPGSTIKAFSTALALQSGQYTPASIIDTRPGWMVIDHHTIHDFHNHGVITLTELLQKSSNVGAAKVMFSLASSDYWNLLRHFGFGDRTDSGFPGESAGVLPYFAEWRRSEIATIAFGYGLAVTTLQLAQAYAILGNHGVKVPVTLLKQSSYPEGVRVFSANTADELIHMLESVLKNGGTGTQAQVAGYTIAGKTGTAYMAAGRGYDHHRYISSFVGLAPAEDPQYVVAVEIHNPKGQHFGGAVSGPVFADVMSGVLRVMGVAQLQQNA